MERFSSLASFCTGKTATRARMGLALCCVALALSVMLYHQVQLVVPRCIHNEATFTAERLHIRFGTVGSPYFGEMDLDSSWRPRILSLGLASWVAGGVSAELPERIGLWTACWFAGMCVMYALYFRSQALLYMLGTYCGVAFGYMPGIASRVYPWDMPALFTFVVFLCFLHRGRLVLLLPLLPFAVLFKESAAILSVAYLFGTGSWRRRGWLCGGALAGCVLARACGYAVAGVAPVSPFNGRLLWSNLCYMAGHGMPLLINGGLLIALLVVPQRHRHAWVLRSVTLLFVMAALVGSVVYEYRVWFELIPLGLYALAMQMQADAGSQELTPSAG